MAGRGDSHEDTHYSVRTWHSQAIPSMVRAQSRQGEGGGVGRVQTESGLGAHDKEFNFISIGLMSWERF